MYTILLLCIPPPPPHATLNTIPIVLLAAKNSQTAQRSRTTSIIRSAATPKRAPRASLHAQRAAFPIPTDANPSDWRRQVCRGFGSAPFAVSPRGLAPVAQGAEVISCAAVPKRRAASTVASPRTGDSIPAGAIRAWAAGTGRSGGNGASGRLVDGRR
jgi:hypothetical protein